MKHLDRTYQHWSILAAVSLLLAASCKSPDLRQPANTQTQDQLYPEKRGRDLVPETGRPPSAANGRVAALEGCNKLGIWLWYIEGTGYASHDALANQLVATGIKRIYIKVGDGAYNATRWPEVVSTAVVQAYKSRGIEVWAWSYNYPGAYAGHEAAQAKTLTQAAQTGYTGYVIDAEVEFDGKPTKLEALMSAFKNVKDQAIANGTAPASFKLYCSTWTNPDEHNFAVNIVDKYVDAHMPQTYVEIMASKYTIARANGIYRNTYGCTKPIHHIVSNEQDRITAATINSFFGQAGGEASLWRVPGGGSPLSIWNTLQAVNWAANFPNYCAPSGAERITATLPAQVETYTPILLNGTATDGVATIRGTIDGYAISNQPTVQNGQFTIGMTLTNTGAARQLVLTGYNTAGAAVGTFTGALKVVAPALSVSIPAIIRQNQSVVFNGLSGAAISQVQLLADGFSLGFATPISGKFSLPYSFNTRGTNRKLEVRGLLANGTQVVSRTYTFSVIR